ncbi:DUF6069 family protein [Glycomyces sp. A-F 0318]|uniref:DUF6069 family protein n=1 Tax=Glycomyces amatae TaxID=2881355 RepID=UPI001E2D2652|nr:DUF6069 family protein [Glycomyces amatae]MCD0445295.1 DUF6069 family protein [Glycomyces amatae]
MSAPEGGWDRNYEEPTRPYPPVVEPPGEQRPAVNIGRLWAGGVGTAVVAALVALVGILLVRGVLGIHILSPSEAGMYGDTTTTTYAFGAFAVAILATGLRHLLLLGMPRPISFFNWIMLLVIAVGVLIPFTVSAEPESQFATAALNLVIGLSIMSLLNSVSAIAMRPGRAEGIGLP